MTIRAFIRIILISAILSSIHALAEGESRFFCRNTNDETTLSVQRSSIHNLTSVIISLRGPLVAAISKEFTNKEPGFYNQINIETPIIRSAECPFEQQHLYFSCLIDKYGGARASNDNGDNEHLPLDLDETNSYLGKLTNYFDGATHSIGFFLYKPGSEEKLFFGEEFGPEQCRYE
jgi:hypothetical protein